MTWQQTIDEEKEISREEGIEIGRASGIAEGAHNQAIETARRMLARGKSTPEEIAEDTGLPLDEVRAL